METEPLYTKIDPELADKADRYVYESKLEKIEITDNMRKLIEISLKTYIEANPIIRKETTNVELEEQ